jgi:hypothetical protein
LRRSSIITALGTGTGYWSGTTLVKRERGQLVNNPELLKPVLLSLSHVVQVGRVEDSMQRSLEAINSIRSSYKKTRRLIRKLGSLHDCGPEMKVLSEKVIDFEETACNAANMLRQEHELGKQQMEEIELTSRQMYLLISAG